MVNGRRDVKKEHLNICLSKCIESYARQPKVLVQGDHNARVANEVVVNVIERLGKPGKTL